MLYFQCLSAPWYVLKVLLVVSLSSLSFSFVPSKDAYVLSSWHFSICYYIHKFI